MQTEMEKKEPRRQVHLRGPGQSLMAVTADGGFLLEDHHIESFKKRTLVVASPIDSLLSQNRQAKPSVFSDSMFCLGTHDRSKATAQC